MNILIISTNRAAAPCPVLPSGPCLVAEAAERAGHTVTLLDLMFKASPLRALQRQLQRRKYDVIGLSVRNIDNNDLQGTIFYIEEVVPVVRTIRKFSDACIILGGASLTVMPEQILRSLGLDTAVAADGEKTFVKLLDRIADFQPFGSIPGVVSLTGGSFKANPPSGDFSGQCTVPVYERWVDVGAYRSRLSTAPLQTKLGCRFHCVYCTYRKIEGEAYRLFDPESAAEAGLRLASAGLSDIEFVDNVFNAPLDHAVAVCESFIRKKVGARLQTVQVNPLYCTHELLAAMERAGFVGIGMTVESASDRVLQGLRKGFTARDVYSAAETVRKHRLPCVWIFLLGGPGETRETVRQTLLFAETMVRPRDAAFFNIGVRIYPGTGLEKIARDQGVLGLPAEEMLKPVFYVSPDLEARWIREQVQKSLNSHLNFMSVDSFRFPHLPFIHRIGYRLGIRSPLWRYTRIIRRGLRLLGKKI